jgi:hypothetical protein
MKAGGRKRLVIMLDIEKLDDRRKGLVKRAISQYGNGISLLFNRTLEECFTEFQGEMYFWFNLENNSTKVTKG